VGIDPHVKLGQFAIGIQFQGFLKQLTSLIRSALHGQIGPGVGHFKRLGVDICEIVLKMSRVTRFDPLAGQQL
jgi:hypothetical protein